MRGTRRKPKTVTTPRPRRAPSPLTFPFRSGFLMTLMGLLLGLLCLWPASLPSSASPRDKKDKKHDQPYALIYGTVWGPDNSPVYGVHVKIRREGEKKVRWELYSDHNGEFAQRVPAGQADYVVWADLKGYKAMNGKPLRAGEEVKVHVEYDERVDIGLHLMQ
jgi:hypothetical protein